jgi:murein DD-endopeptidase MepM/ murein hydrolase activator NlpD
MQLAGRRRWLLAAGFGLSACLGLAAWQQFRTSRGLIHWFTNPAARPDLITQADLTPCAGAPFILPSSGFVGLLWGDARLPYSSARKHSGIDIFGDGEIGEIPVYTAYEGYLTRLGSWKSAVIIRHPHDPLNPSRQVWTYYAHMADRDGRSFILDAFPAGTVEMPVKQGDLIGYQGNFNGGNGAVGLHLHFSIVRDDGRGRFLNETDPRNTLDPSAYLGMELNYSCADGVAECVAAPQCP